MFIFYAISLVPLLIGLFLFLKNKRVVWWEYLISSLVALGLAIGFNVYAYMSSTGDKEVISGEITSAHYIPSWTEYYEEAIYRTEYYQETEWYTDSNGKSRSRTVTKSRRVFDHWESRTRFHPEICEKKSNINTEYSITRSEYNHILSKFKKQTSSRGIRYTMEHNSRMLSGDPMDYTAVNTTGYVFPVTAVSFWVNKLLKKNTIYSFAEVPENVDIPEYPIPSNHFISNRLIGTGFNFQVQDLDIVNAKIGPAVHCNLIIVQFPGKTGITYSEYLKSKWLGGKQNDLIICIGGNPNKPEWTQVISWSESEKLKIELRQYVLEKGMTLETLKNMQSMIISGFKKRNWKDFDYIQIEPEMSDVFFYVFALLFSQIGIWWWIISNNHTRSDECFKTNKNSNYDYARNRTRRTCK